MFKGNDSFLTHWSFVADGPEWSVCFLFVLERVMENLVINNEIGLYRTRMNDVATHVTGFARLFFIFFVYFVIVCFIFGYLCFFSSHNLFRSS